MVRVVILAALMLLAARPEVVAQEGRAAFGAGTSNSCAVWMQVRKPKSSDADPLVQWVTGFLSGLNNQSDVDVLSGSTGTDFHGAMAWIDNYGRSNPLDKVVIAVGKVFDELKSRTQRRLTTRH